MQTRVLQAIIIMRKGKLMSTFRCAILKVFNTYKRSLDSGGKNKEKVNLIRELNINRKQLQQADEIMLYHRAIQLQAKLDSCLSSKSYLSPWHCGMEECRLHLSQILSQYKIIGRRVVNSSQQASRSLVSALQLLALESQQLTKHKQTLQQYGQNILHYGTPTQRKLYQQALKKHDIPFHI